MMLAAAAVMLSCSLACAQGLSIERQVSGQSVLSERDPAVRITLPAQARYVGAHRWTLYDVADCELHLFVEADGSKQVQRLYWIQFEGYIPSRPELHYDYSDNALTEFAGRQFYTNVSFGDPNRTSRPGSDFEQMQKLVREKGYVLGDYSMNVRLVHVFDDGRKELMFIYGEDMKPTGLTPDDLNPGGSAEKQRPKIEQQLIDNAKKRIAIEWEPKK